MIHSNGKSGRDEIAKFPSRMLESWRMCIHSLGWKYHCALSLNQPGPCLRIRTPNNTWGLSVESRLYRITSLVSSHSELVSGTYGRGLRFVSGRPISDSALQKFSQYPILFM